MNPGPWQSLPERIGRLEATIESLIRENGELRRRVDNATEAEQILRRAQAPPAPPQPGQPTHKRDRSHLHVVRGLVAAAGLATGWVLRSRSHKAATLGLMAVVAAAGAGTPSMITGTPPPSAPSRAHRAPARMPTPAVPARPRRRSTGRSATVTPAPSPSPSATASPSAVNGGVQPSPLATVTPLPSPVPVPSALCVQLTDKACDHNQNCVCGPDGDGDADDVLAAA